jgi:DNA-binding phage protein
MSTNRSYRSYLIESLKDPYEAAAYLEAVLDDGSFEEIRLALRNVVEAQISILGDTTLILRRQEINEWLNQQNQFNFIDLSTILSDLDFRISISPKQDSV